MGLTPIQYGPWKGSRSEHGRRFLTIANQVFHQKLSYTLFTMLYALCVILMIRLTLNLFAMRLALCALRDLENGRIPKWVR